MANHGMCAVGKNVDDALHSGARGRAQRADHVGRGAARRHRRAAREGHHRLRATSTTSSATTCGWRDRPRLADQRRAPDAAGGHGPPDPGAGAAGAADYVDRLLGAFTFDPPRIFAGGPFSGRFGGEAVVRPTSSPLGADRGAAPGARASRARAACPSASSTDRSSAGRTSTATGSPRSATTSPTVDGDEQDRRLALDAELRALLYEHACEGAYGAPEYGGNRDARRLGGDRLRRRRAAARLHRRRGVASRDRERLDCDAVDRRHRPGGRDRRRRAHRARAGR